MQGAGAGGRLRSLARISWSESTCFIRPVGGFPYQVQGRAILKGFDRL